MKWCSKSTMPRGVLPADVPLPRALQEQLRSIKKELGLEKDDKSALIQKCASHNVPLACQGTTSSFSVWSWTAAGAPGQTQYRI